MFELLDCHGGSAAVVYETECREDALSHADAYELLTGHEVVVLDVLAGDCIVERVAA